MLRSCCRSQLPLRAAVVQSWCPSTPRKDRGSKGCALEVTLAGEGERHQKSSVGCICGGGVCSHSDIQHLETPNYSKDSLCRNASKEKPALSLNFSKRGQRWCSQSSNGKDTFWEQRHHYLNRCNIWWLEAEDINSWLNEKCNLIKEANSKFIWRWGEP